MTRILAIEPNPERGALLRRLVRDAVRADVTLVTSTKTAIVSIDAHRPDLILTSSLLTPKDDRDLIAHLRQTPSLRDLQVLSIPPVAEPQATNTPGLLARLRGRRRAPPVPAYDFGAIVARIEEALAQSKIAAQFDIRDRPQVIVDTPPAPTAQSIEIPACKDVFTKRTRATRWEGWQLPWLKSINVPGGIEARLINLSSTGLLVESGARIAPGAATTFRLWGPHRDLTVPARIVRSEVASVDRFGVKYHAAAVFDFTFDTMMPDPIEAGVHLDDLVETIRRKADGGASAAELRVEFEAGIMKLVSVRDVRLRDVPVAENDGRESVYFTVSRSDAPAVLQVTFEANYQPRADEFNALKAAAAAAARIVDAIGTARQIKITARTAPARVSAPLRLVPHASESALELRPTA
jgi:CheY-like chemotaxis protein